MFFENDEKVKELLNELYLEHGSWENVASFTDVQERTINRILYESKRVELDVLDRLTLHTRHQLWEFSEVELVA